MINREMRTALVTSCSKELDAYGVPIENPQSRTIEVTLKLYQHSRVEDIRFNDVTHLALTFDKQITDADKLQIDGKTYKVEFVNNEGRLAQVFLKHE